MKVLALELDPVNPRIPPLVDTSTRDIVAHLIEHEDVYELAKSIADFGFVYLDPPYHSKGDQLYLNHYTAVDHVALAEFLSQATFPWVMSYDDVPEIRRLYSRYRRVSFNLGYSARECKLGKELLIIPDHVRFPTAWRTHIPNHFITSADRISIPMPIQAAALA